MELLQTTFDLTDVQVKIAQSILAVIALIAARQLVLRAIHRRTDDTDVAYRARKITRSVFAVLVVAALVWIWLEPLGNLATFLGLVSAGIAIALADLLKNMAGWFYVATRRPFRVDDRVQVGDIAGDVIDIRLFRTTMLEIGVWVDADQSTGRIVHVPNSAFLTDPVHNFTEGFAYLWHEVGVLVTYESDWQLGERLVLDVLTELTRETCEAARRDINHASRHHKIRFTHFTPKVWVSAKDSGVLLTGRMLVPVRQRRSFDEQAWRGILTALASEPQVQLAYPTLRMVRSDGMPPGPGTTDRLHD